MALARAYLVVVACLWGFTITICHQVLGQEKAGGPPLLQSVGWAAALASPLVIGAWVIETRGLLGHVLRVASGAALILEVCGAVLWIWLAREFLFFVLRTESTGGRVLELAFTFVPPLYLSVAAAVLIAAEVRSIREARDLRRGTAAPPMSTPRIAIRSGRRSSR